MKKNQTKLLLISYLLLLLGLTVRIQAEFTVFPEDAESDGTKSFLEFGSGEYLLTIEGHTDQKDARNNLNYSGTPIDVIFLNKI